MDDNGSGFPLAVLLSSPQLPFMNVARLMGSITIMNGGHLLSASTLFVTINYFKSIILFLPKLLLLLMPYSTQTVESTVWIQVKLSKLE